MRVVSNVFGKQRRSNTTADEHKMYMRIFAGWLEVRVRVRVMTIT